jgi:hypothetical protein
MAHKDKKLTGRDRRPSTGVLGVRMKLADARAVRRLAQERGIAVNELLKVTLTKLLQEERQLQPQ